MNMLDYVGKVIINADGRSIKVEAAYPYPVEPFFLLRWLDTNEVFCEFPEKIIFLIGD